MSLWRLRFIASHAADLQPSTVEALRKELRWFGRLEWFKILVEKCLSQAQCAKLTLNQLLDKA